MTIAIFSLVPLLLLELSGAGGGRIYRSSRSLVVGITLTALVLSPAIAVAKFWWGSTTTMSSPARSWRGKLRGSGMKQPACLYNT